MEQKPSIGRIVIFRPSNGDNLYPAIITRVWSETCVNLEVFGGVQAHEEIQGKTPTSVLLGGTGIARTWSWPPRV